MFAFNFVGLLFRTSPPDTLLTFPSDSQDVDGDDADAQHDRGASQSTNGTDRDGIPSLPCREMPLAELVRVTRPNTVQD